jgi:hypothetical protein
VVGADDSLCQEAAPDPGFLDRLSRFFSPLKRSDEAEDQAVPALVEHLADQSDQVTVVIPEEEK